uniref:protein-ribulosamine 3-kinase n=1 Tax=Melanopsichium pennsylvanicum 4 TaxID=1398559 RepID=A0A077R5I2_9BASI|nr:conserved hypothetical protein [Melanopsichium pennsylvanicum 4]
MALDRTLEQILHSECSHLGTSFASRGASCVIVQPSNRALFAKIESSVEQTIGEAESLKAMFAALAWSAGRLVPKVHASGKTSDGRQAYLITDYLDLKPSVNRAGQKMLGQKLAQMHQKGLNERGKFGFDVATFCGVTRQDNTWSASWPKFWADQRIGDLVNRIHIDRPDNELKDLETQMRDKVYPVLLAPLEGKVKPSILHGDLCSSYYGHNEAELGIMNMFGGFTQDFFDAYHEVIPRTEPYYDERSQLYELYHQ